MEPIVTMEVCEHPIKEFMARYPRYEPKIKDHSAIITAKRCFREYFYRIVLGRVPKEDAIYFAWGSAYHKFREVLEITYGFGSNAPPRFDEGKAKGAFAEAALAGLNYWRKHGRDQGPEDKFSWMTAPRLLESFKKAYENWILEKKQGKIEVIAVEQAFNIQLPDGSYRSGRADQIVKWMSKTWGRDFKTSSKDSAFYSRTLAPNEQFTGYTYCEGELTGESIQGQIIEVLYNAKSTKKEQKGPEIIEYTASRTAWELAIWEKELMIFNKMIDSCRETDTWPMCETNCSFCTFHNVCKQGSEAAQMYQLEVNYRVEPWDNQKVGKD